MLVIFILTLIPTSLHFAHSHHIMATVEELMDGIAVHSNGTNSFLTKTELVEFKEIFPEITEKLIKLNENTFPKNNDMGRMTEWMIKVIDYNVSPEPTSLGGCLVPGALKCVMKDTAIPMKQMKFAYLLGWCLEFSHGARDIADDIIYHRNGSESIDSKLPWHKMNNLGMVAINDSFILRAMNYNTLKLFFGKEPYYYDLQHVARDNLQKNVLGRALWEQMEKQIPVSKEYTVERYRQVNDFMRGYHTFYLPFQFALIIAGLDEEPELKKLLKKLMLEIGYYNQLGNDFQNIFGNCQKWLEGATGKLRRLNWFFVTALELLSVESNGETQCTVAELLEYIENDPKVNNAKQLREVYRNLGLVEKLGKELKMLKEGILYQVQYISKEHNISAEFFHSILTTVEVQGL